MDGAAWTGRHGRVQARGRRACRQRSGRAGSEAGVPAAKMSVGGSTVVFVTRPTVIARATGGHGYGYGGVPVAQPELALVKPTAAEGAEAGVAEAGVAEARFAEASFAELEFAELEFAVIDLETTGWSP